MKSLVIRVGDQKYAIAIDQIIHIIEPVKLEKMPHVPSYVLGALNFHGDLIMVIDLAQLLNIKGCQYDPMQSAMVVCQLNEIKFALVFDEVISVEELEGCVGRIMGGQVLALDLNKIIDQERLHV